MFAALQFDADVVPLAGLDLAGHALAADALDFQGVAVRCPSRPGSTTTWRARSARGTGSGSLRRRPACGPSACRCSRSRLCPPRPRERSRRRWSAAARRPRPSTRRPAASSPCVPSAKSQEYSVLVAAGDLDVLVLGLGQPRCRRRSPRPWAARSPRARRPSMGSTTSPRCRLNICCT